MQWYYAAVFLVLGTAWCQNEIPENLQDLGKQLGAMSDFANFNQSGIPSIEEVQDAIRKKCEKNGGGEEAFDKLLVAKDFMQECVESNFNFTQIEEELEESKKTGSMEEVFGKYCLKTPIVKACIRNLTNTIEPCLEPEERKTLQTLVQVIESLTDFGCHKDGDRMAIFIAEGGLECIKAKRDGLEQCANETLAHRIPTDFSLTNLPLFVIDEEGCTDFKNVHACVIKVLETCDDSTPANIVDALFKFVRRITPCATPSDLKSVAGALSHNRIRRSYSSQAGLNPLNAVFEQVKDKYRPHCMMNGGQKAIDEFEKALSSTKTCSNRTFQNFGLKKDALGGLPYEYMCNEFRYGLRDCLGTLTQKMEACSSRAEAYVPKFGLELFDSVFNFYCKDNARSLKKFLSEGQGCFQKMLTSTSTCLNRTKHIKDLSKAVVTKSEMCIDLKLLRNCHLDIAAQQCGGNANSNEFITGLSDALYAPCSACSLMVTHLLLFLLFLTKVF